MSVTGIQYPSSNQDSSLSMLLCKYTLRLNQEHSGNNKTFRSGFLSPNFRKNDLQISWVKLVTINFITQASKNLLFLCIWGWKIWTYLCETNPLWSLFLLFIL